MNDVREAIAKDQHHLPLSAAAALPTLILAGGGRTKTGGNGPDRITGSKSDDLLRGLAGNDTLQGLGGADTLDGGKGADVMQGGAGNDLYLVDHAKDRIVEKAKAGRDVVRSSIDFTLGSGVEELQLIGGKRIDGVGNDLANTITGNRVANMLSGAGGNDRLNGGGGNDTLDGGRGRDKLFGGNGNDTFLVKGANHLQAGEEYVGGAGLDRLDGRVEKAAVVLAADIRFVSVESIVGFSGGLVLSAGQLAAFTKSVEIDGEITIRGQTDLDLSGRRFEARAVNLSDSNDRLVIEAGYAGYEGGGYERVLGFYGSIHAGAGNDTISLIGGDTASAYYGYQAPSPDVFGEAGDDILSGAISRDRLYGGDGNDQLFGGSLVDHLYGGAGRDSLYGGSGDDTVVIETLDELETGEILDGGTGIDVIRYSGKDKFDLRSLDMTGFEGLVGFSGGLILAQSNLPQIVKVLKAYGGVELAEGGTFDLSMVSLFDTAGFTLSDADTTLVLAIGGYDSYGTGYGYGEAGYYDRNPGWDTGWIRGGAGNDHISLSAQSDRYGAAIEIFGNDGDDTLFGSLISSDSLFGGAGNDVLDAKGFDGGGYSTTAGDLLEGGAGDDLFIGGSGSDVFVFGLDARGFADRITDFGGLLADGATTPPEDHDYIRVEGGIGTTAYIGDTAFTAIGTTEIRHAGSGLLEVDHDGDGISDFTIAITGMDSGDRLTQDHFI